MMSLNGRYTAYLVILNGLLVMGLICFGDRFFSEAKSFVWTGIAMAVFFLYEIMVILLTGVGGKALSPRQSINLFLGLKVGKVILSLLFIAVYAVVVNVELRRFVLVFVLLYFFYLLFDTIYLASREKQKRVIKDK
jgi:hypothetical protein